MNRRTFAAAAIGAIVGGFLGLIAFALGAARVVDGGLSVLGGDSGPTGAVITVTQSGLYLFVSIAGAAAGAILAAVGYAVGSQSDPSGRRYPLGPIAALGAAIGAPVAFASARAAFGLASDIVANVVIVSGFRAGWCGLIAGAATGAVVAATMERLSRPETIGFEGAAVPRSFGRFVRDAVAAVGLPAVGLVAGGLLVFGLSRILLAAEGVTALFVFGGAAAVVLFGTALIAALPRRKR